MQRACVKVILPDVRVWTVAQELQTTNSLSYWDALLIAACIVGGVTTLYSEDMQPRTIRGVQIVNPFAP